MKWAVFFTALLLVYPAGLLLRGRPRLRIALWTTLGLLPFVGLGAAFDINLIFYEHYRGDSRGIEVTIVDLLVLALYVSLPKGPHRAPFRAARYTYLAVALISVVQALDPIYSWFSIWKLVRMYVVLAVVSRACKDDRVVVALLKGMAVGVISQLGMVIYQRYVLGFHQTPGFFAHPNSLGSALNLLAPVWLALILSSRKGLLASAALLSTAVSLVMSLSRGAIATFVGVAGLMWLGFTLIKPAPQTFLAALISMMLAAAIFAKAGDSVIGRFLNAPRASAEGRRIMEDASAAMLRDHPLGIGINQYSLVAIQEGYWERAAAAYGREPTERQYSGVAHNIYWLNAAELGYLGIIAFAWLLAAPIYLAFRFGWRAREEAKGVALLGLGFGLAALYLHGLLEWTMRQTSISYLFWMIAAMVHALASQVKTAHAAAASQRRATNSEETATGLGGR